MLSKMTPKVKQQLATWNQKGTTSDRRNGWEKYAAGGGGSQRDPKGDGNKVQGESHPAEVLRKRSRKRQHLEATCPIWGSHLCTDWSLEGFLIAAFSA